MKRMSQGKGRGSKVKMVYKENERKTPKKPQTNHSKKKKTKNTGEMEQWQKEREEKRMHKA